MGKVLGIVYRAIATHLIKKAGFTRKTAHTGAVTLIQCFGGSLNLDVDFHMLFLDGVYVEGRHGTLERFQWVKSPTGDELARLTHTIARRAGRFLERQGLIESDAETGTLVLDGVDDDSMAHLHGHSITYRIAMGPQTGRKVFTLQTLPACDPNDPLVGKTAGFSLHAGVSAKARERDRLERLCRLCRSLHNRQYVDLLVMRTSVDFALSFTWGIALVGAHNRGGSQRCDEPVGRTEFPGSKGRWFHLRERLDFRRWIGLQVDVGCLRAGMSEPQRDLAQIARSLERV